jgi:hypothetical protein
MEALNAIDDVKDSHYLSAQMPPKSRYRYTISFSCIGNSQFYYTIWL